MLREIIQFDCTETMNTNHHHKIASELGITAGQVSSVDELIAGGGTVPFIARYRKEQTGSLDEVQITQIRDRLLQLSELDNRREAILKSLEERELLTEELKVKIEAVETISELEDIYLPFRPKRRTRAMIARERGLEPLAEAIFAQDSSLNPILEAEKYIDAEKGVESAEDALAGARDIIAEWVSENENARREMRALFMREGILTSKVITGKEEDGVKYRDYFDWKEPASKAPSHRILAIRRGENEGFLSMRILPEEESVWKILDRLFIKNNSLSAHKVLTAIRDSYKRLLGPSMETELRVELKIRADKEAIRVFAENLRELLLAPPLGEKNVMAIDPGFRTGCKVVCLNRAGDLLHNETIFPFSGEKALAEAGKRLIEMVKKYEVEVIAVGNGTAGRETVTFARALEFGWNIAVMTVNESGASIYSASKAARDEFPDYDVTVRGAVSIGRRLMDPLAELVKIDPKSIGVGQYQHDVDQKELQSSLEDVVVICVNAVGVDLNTASPHLLAYVSGLKPSIAENIVEYRSQNGRFQSRKELMKVPGFGPKTFELSAGFIRIRGGENPLDASSVHPESYRIVEAMAHDLECGVADLMTDSDLRARLNLEKYIDDRAAMPTLQDILAELAKPGRDPRKEFEMFYFSEEATEIGHLKPGMNLPGVVTNVTNFGAFVDIGVHQDGLVHISQLADRYVKHPSEVVRVNQKVRVTVLEVDAPRKRIALSIKKNPLLKQG